MMNFFLKMQKYKIFHYMAILFLHNMYGVDCQRSRRQP